MVYKNTISMDNENELPVQMFSEATDDVATCSNDLLFVAEAIAQSCLMIGTTSGECSDIHSLRVEDFKMLVEVYKTRSRRFEGIVDRLVGDIEEDAVLPENALAENG